MPLLSQKEVLNLKLSSIPLKHLKTLALNLGLGHQGKVASIVKELLEIGISESELDDFIKQRYERRIQERKAIISDEDLQTELMKVGTFSWSVVQGQLDRKIQSEYVRRFVRYEDLLSNVKAKLHSEITNYVVCTWFNHWTTVLIEEHMGRHPKVIPTPQEYKRNRYLL